MPLFLCLGGKVSSNCPLRTVVLDPCQTKVSVGHGCCPNDTEFTNSVKMELGDLWPPERAQSCTVLGRRTFEDCLRHIYYNPPHHFCVLCFINFTVWVQSRDWYGKGNEKYLLQPPKREEKKTNRIIHSVKTSQEPTTYQASGAKWVTRQFQFSNYSQLSQGDNGPKEPQYGAIRCRCRGADGVDRQRGGSLYGVRLSHGCLQFRSLACRGETVSHRLQEWLEFRG